MAWCPTDGNAADIFTKSLGTRKFKKFQAFLDFSGCLRMASSRRSSVACFLCSAFVTDVNR